MPGRPKTKLKRELAKLSSGGVEDALSPRARDLVTEMSKRRVKEPTTRDEHVKVILRMMRMGLWDKASSYEYAEKHGLAPVTARGYAAEAGRVDRLSDDEERSEMLAATVGRIDRVEREAMKEGDLKAAIAALTLSSNILGLTGMKGGTTTAVQVNVHQAPAGVPAEVATAWGGESTADHRVLVRHVLTEALHDVLSWEASDERAEVLRGVVEALRGGGAL